jgi:hypothetical protein
MELTVAQLRTCHGCGCLFMLRVVTLTRIELSGAC